MPISADLYLFKWYLTIFQAAEASVGTTPRAGGLGEGVVIRVIYADLS
jgi:hypothetical protein